MHHQQQQVSYKRRQQIGSAEIFGFAGYPRPSPLVVLCSVHQQCRNPLAKPELLHGG